ncbi:MAG TPA: hypothetical protein VFC41_01445 [Anaerovoracaceae bacterium]|nr:hypothetical protein [Anaerovoracaceae bacterium]
MDNQHINELEKIMDERIALITKWYYENNWEDEISDVVEVNDNSDDCSGPIFDDAGEVHNLFCDDILNSNDQHGFATACAKGMITLEESALANHILKHAQTKQCETSDIDKIINYVLTKHNNTKDQMCLIFCPHDLYDQLNKKCQDDNKIKIRRLEKLSTQIIFVGYKSVRWTRNTGCTLDIEDYKSHVCRHHQYLYRIKHINGSKIDFRIRSQNKYELIHPDHVRVYNLRKPNN